MAPNPRQRPYTRRGRGVTDCGSPAKGSDRWRWFGAEDTPTVRQRKDARALRRRAAAGYAAVC